MADANANLVEPDKKILKDITNVLDDDDSKANIIIVQGEIHEVQVSSNEPTSTKEVVRNDGTKDEPDEDESKGEMSACDDTDEEEDVKEKKMNNDEEAMEELIANLHTGELPPTSIGKEAKNGASPLNYLRCQCAKRGRSTLLLFYRLWRNQLVKKFPPHPPRPL